MQQAIEHGGTDSSDTTEQIAPVLERTRSEAVAASSTPNVFYQAFLIIFLRLAIGLHIRGPISEFDFSSGPHAKIL